MWQSSVRPATALPTLIEMPLSFGAACGMHRCLDTVDLQLQTCIWTRTVMQKQLGDSTQVDALGPQPFALHVILVLQVVRLELHCIVAHGHMLKGSCRACQNQGLPTCINLLLHYNGLGATPACLSRCTPVGPQPVGTVWYLAGTSHSGIVTL